ncbi:MAG: Rne/Rng family ribonuclease [Firmicutes bacterium]|jgi:ribonuclease G|nr:Rne/Rng family ribonuclease [Bacillota bacterium]
MRKEIIVNVSLGETRAAVLEDGLLVELYVERENSERIVGNIYKGRVENVLPGMQAAFVDIGLERNAFLYVDDALAYRNAERDMDEPLEKPSFRNITDLLKSGQHIMVQVTKEPMGTKGARVVTHVSIPGRYLVYMPTVDYIGISRRIVDEQERARLKALAKKIRPKGTGLIVRTVAEGKDEKDLAEDCRFLESVWATIQQKAKKGSPPALLYKDHDLIYRLVRDIFDADVDKFVIDNKTEYLRTLELLSSISPHLRSRVFLYHGSMPLFESYGAEAQIESVLQRKVWLKSGGYLVIDRTEALTSIDVNTGRYVGTTNLADTVLHTNLEAATEIARQLRLRDIGGIIILDFIDMESKEDERRVLERLEAEIKRDKTKTHVLGFTSLGLVEMTRKKVRQDLGDFLHRECPCCQGTGRVLSEATVALRAQREILRMSRTHSAEAFLIEVHPSVAGLLIGTGGANLRQLEESTGKTLYVRGRQDLHVEEILFAAMGSKEDVGALAMPVKEGQVLELTVDEPHMSNPRDGIGRLEGYVIDIDGAGNRVGQRLMVEVTKVYRTYAKGRVVAGQAL